MQFARVFTQSIQPLKGVGFVSFRSSLATRTRTTVRDRMQRTVKARVEEIRQAPTTTTPPSFVGGKVALATGSVVALGALCYYGLRAPQGDSAFERASAGMWSPVVRERIHATYMYFGSSVAITAAGTIAVLRSPKVMRLVSQGGWMSLIGGMVVVMGTGILTMSLPYPERGFGVKHLAWALHSSVIGAIIAPVCLIGGPVVMQAALYTAGIVGGMSALAMCAPSDKFLTMGGPLAIGLGVVFVSSLGSMFVSPVSALGAGLYSISMYGGLLLFSAFLLYDTQKIIYKAEQHPDPAVSAIAGHRIPPFDPINNAIGIYMDTINIFIRLVAILSGGSKKR